MGSTNKRRKISLTTRLLNSWRYQLKHYQQNPSGKGTGICPPPWLTIQVRRTLGSFDWPCNGSNPINWSHSSWWSRVHLGNAVSLVECGRNGFLGRIFSSVVVTLCSALHTDEWITLFHHSTGRDRATKQICLYMRMLLPGRKRILILRAGRWRWERNLSGTYWNELTWCLQIFEECFWRLVSSRVCYTWFSF